MLSGPQLSYLSELLKDASRDRPLEILSLGAALEDLALATLETSRGRAIVESRDRRSLAGDVGRAITSCGASLQRGLDPQLRVLYHDAVARLGSVLSDTHASQLVQARTQGLLERLSAPDASRAALRDLIDAVADGSASHRICAHRASQFRDIAERRGHWWTFYPGEVTAALAKGEQDALDLVAEPMRDDIVVVWLAFGNAVLRQSCRRVGPIQFFTDQLETRHLREGCPALAVPGFVAAWELTDDKSWLFEDVEAERYVLARVELTGPNAVSPPAEKRGMTAMEWARDLADGVVASAAFRDGGSGWRLLNGEIFFSADGDHGGTLGFDDPRKTVHVEEWAHLNSDPTGEGLADLDSAYVTALAEGEPGARAALAAVRWHNATSSVPDPAQRIVLRVRGFERELGAGSRLPWYRLVRDYLGYDLAFDDIGQQLVRAGVRAHFHAKLGSDASDLLAAVTEIYTTGNHGGWQVNVPAVIRHASALAPVFPAGSGGRRMLREVARNSATGARMRQWITDAEQRCSLLLARSARQRNNIVHGRDTVPAVVASVDGFLELVSGTLVATGLHTSGASVVEHLSHGKKLNRERLDRLFNASSGIGLYQDAV